MSVFTLHLESSVRYERIERVASFVAEDASGKFGLLAGHERFVTALVPGLARLRLEGGGWQYLALAWGAVYFDAGELHVATGPYMRGDDPAAMREALRDRLQAEDEAQRELRASVRRLEEQMLKRLYELERAAAR